MDILIRPLREADLFQADEVFRLAFGTFNGLADPRQFGGDVDRFALVGWLTRLRLSGRGLTASWWAPILSPIGAAWAILDP
jgi:hypothetical protein